MGITCPVCNTKFEAELWENGNCPECGNGYWWEDYWNEETNESWYQVEWNKYEN